MPRLFSHHLFGISRLSVYSVVSTPYDIIIMRWYKDSNPGGMLYRIQPLLQFSCPVKSPSARNRSEPPRTAHCLDNPPKFACVRRNPPRGFESAQPRFFSGSTSTILFDVYIETLQKSNQTCSRSFHLCLALPCLKFSCVFVFSSHRAFLSRRAFPSHYL